MVLHGKCRQLCDCFGTQELIIEEANGCQPEALAIPIDLLAIEGEGVATPCLYIAAILQPEGAFLFPVKTVYNGTRLKDHPASVKGDHFIQDIVISGFEVVLKLTLYRCQRPHLRIPIKTIQKQKLEIPVLYPGYWARRWKLVETYLHSPK